MNKKGLDERQLHRRNMIGNQMFLLLLYALMLDAGLYGFGFRWISYPANIMLILTICSGIYVVRLISNSAYVGPSTEKERPFLKTFLMILVSVAVAGAITVLVKVSDFGSNSQIDEMAAPILFIAAFVALAVAVTTIIIKRVQDKDDTE